MEFLTCVGPLSFLSRCNLNCSENHHSEASSGSGVSGDRQKSSEKPDFFLEPPGEEIVL